MVTSTKNQKQKKAFERYADSYLPAFEQDLINVVSKSTEVLTTIGGIVGAFETRAKNLALSAVEESKYYDHVRHALGQCIFSGCLQLCVTLSARDTSPLFFRYISSTSWTMFSHSKANKSKAVNPSEWKYASYHHHLNRVFLDLLKKSTGGETPYIQYLQRYLDELESKMTEQSRLHLKKLAERPEKGTCTEC